MAVYDLEEQEKIDDLKAWWAVNGKYVSAAVVIFAVGFIGVQGWRWYQGTQAEKASVLYQAVSQAGRANDAVKAKEPATQLGFGLPHNQKFRSDEPIGAPQALRRASRGSASAPKAPVTGLKKCIAATAAVSAATSGSSAWMASTRA